jgi:N-acetylmuramoyl-L-alanine amidase
MVKKTMWDPGHGGSDPGGVGNGLQEEHLTLKIVEYSMAYLNANYTGFEQRSNRGNEQTLELNRRDDAADAWGADVFVSVHINAGGGTGFESFIYTSPIPTESALQNILHEEVLEAMKQFGPITNRGKKKANFAVLRETSMPSVLTENLFIDSNDSNYLKNEEFIKAVGEAHARGVAKFLGLKEKQNQKEVKNVKYTDKVTVPNTAFWQAISLVNEYQAKGFKCYADPVSFKPFVTPKDSDAFRFVVETDFKNAQVVLMELRKRGYSKAVWETI